MRMPKSHDLGRGRGHVIRISKLPKITKIYCVQPAVPQYIVLVRDPITHSYIKYINVRYYYIRELVAFNKVIIKYILIDI